MDALEQAPCLAHACDEPLCTRIGAGHVTGSTPRRNRSEWAVRRHTLGTPLRDRRGARGRAEAIRASLRTGYDPARWAAELTDGLTDDLRQAALFDLTLSHAGQVR